MRRVLAVLGIILLALWLTGVTVALAWSALGTAPWLGSSTNSALCQDALARRRDREARRTTTDLAAINRDIEQYCRGGGR